MTVFFFYVYIGFFFIFGRKKKILIFIEINKINTLSFDNFHKLIKHFPCCYIIYSFLMFFSLSVKKCLTTFEILELK